MAIRLEKEILMKNPFVFFPVALLSIIVFVIIILSLMLLSFFFCPVSY